MTDVNQFHEEIFDEFAPKKKMPDMLNVLTILTFIWSGITMVSGIISYFMICNKVVKESQNAQPSLGNGFLARLMEENKFIAERGCELRLPQMLITVIFAILCIVGAIMMRKLKKSGYFIYLIGEIGAPLGFIALFGYTGFIAGANFFFPVLFLILYATQLKHLTK